MIALQASFIRRYNRKIILIVLLFPLIGVFIALFPPIAAALLAILGVSFLFFLPIKSLLLLAIFFAPFSSLFIIHINIIDLRLIQLLWLIILVKKIIKAAESKNIVTPRTGIWIPSIILVFSAFLSMLASIQPLISLKETVQLVYLLVVFLTIAFSINDLDDLKQAFNILIFAAMLVTIIGLLSVILGYSPIPAIEVDALNNFALSFDYPEIILSRTFEGLQVIRLSAVNLDSVAVAAFLTQILLLLICLFWFNTTSGYKHINFIFGSTLILSLVAWFLTNSRAATVSLFALLILATLITGKHRYTTLFLMLIFLVIFILTPSYSRFKDTFILEAASNPGHYALWYEAANIFLNNPINGIGIGMFPIVVMDYLRFLNIQTYISGANDVHNMLLKIAAEMGIVGLVALFWFLLIFFIDLWKSYLRNRETNYSGLYLGLFLTSIAGVLMNMTTNIIIKEFTWTIWGIAYAGALLSRNVIRPAKAIMHPDRIAESL